jgi:hypothetical protein
MVSGLGKEERAKTKFVDDKYGATAVYICIHNGKVKPIALIMNALSWRSHRANNDSP